MNLTNFLIGSIVILVIVWYVYPMLFSCGECYSTLTISSPSAKKTSNLNLSKSNKKRNYYPPPVPAK